MSEFNQFTSYNDTDMYGDFSFDGNNVVLGDDTLDALASIDFTLPAPEITQSFPDLSEISYEQLMEFTDTLENLPTPAQTPTESAATIQLKNTTQGIPLEQSSTHEEPQEESTEMSGESDDVSETPERELENSSRELVSENSSAMSTTESDDDDASVDAMDIDAVQEKINNSPPKTPIVVNSSPKRAQNSQSQLHKKIQEHFPGHIFIEKGSKWVKEDKAQVVFIKPFDLNTKFCVPSSGVDYAAIFDNMDKGQIIEAVKRTPSSLRTEDMFAFVANAFQKLGLKKYPCPCCDHKAANVSNFIRHCCRKHIKCKAYQCGKCDERFLYTESAIKHVNHCMGFELKYCQVKEK